MSRIKVVMSRWLVLGAVLLTGVAGCAGYYRDGPPYYTSAYHHTRTTIITIRARISISTFHPGTTTTGMVVTGSVSGSCRRITVSIDMIVCVSG